MDTQQKKTSEVSVERLDDIPLLIALQQRMGLSRIIDEAIPRHWRHQGLSLGQLVVGWNAYILSQADHRKVAVEQWACEHQQILSHMLGTCLRRTDFTDDRLSQVLSHLADEAAWRTIENELWQNSVSVYQLMPERVRLDASRFSGYHTPVDDGLMQHDYNAKTPELTQVKLMTASIDCGTSGHLLSTDVVSGEKADDPLYQPMIQNVRQTLNVRGLLYIGDSKMSAIETRAQLAAGGDFYLMPLAKVGDVPKLFDECITPLVTGSQPATLIYTTDDSGQPDQLIAAGYQTTRSQTTQLPDDESYTWSERILVVRSLAQAKKQFATLKANLEKATEALRTLTPSPGRGRKQIRTEEKLIEKADAILAKYKVADFLHYTYHRDESVKTRYIGRGRGSANRQKRQVTTVRYHMTKVTRDEAMIHQAYQRMGFRLYATNQPEKQLPLDSAVLLYRAAPRIERNFHLFKAAPIGISPMYVKNDDQIKGLTRLLSLCVRLLTLIEIVSRRRLKAEGQTLAGLYEGNPTRETNQPTATRLLHAFRGIDCVRFANRASPYTTPLNDLQRNILSLLSINEAVYQPKPPESRWVILGKRCGQLFAKIRYG